MAGISDQFGRVLRGRYRLDSALGTGGSARVYLATDVDLRRQVAIKILHPGFANDTLFFRRFQTEARTAAALNHPNVVHVYDWGEDDGEPFLVLEYLAGGSVRALLDRSTLSETEVARIGGQAARGLEYAHSRGVIHRDIKPANLLLDEAGAVKVADFGIARALAEAPMTEPGGVILGTARYVSPEQVVRETLTDRSDIYSLALVCWEALVGRPAFGAETLQATLDSRVGSGALPLPAELGSLGGIIRAATADIPADRPSAGAFAAELERLASDSPAESDLTVPIPPAVSPPTGQSSSPVLDGGDDTRLVTHVDSTAALDGPRGRTSRRHRRRSRRTIVAAVVALLLVLAGGATYGYFYLYDHSVPKVVGLSAATADKVIKSKGLVLGHTTSIFSTVASGDVVTQSLRSGTQVKRGTSIDLVISKGRRPVPVPRVIGLTRASAIAALRTAHLLWHSTRVYSESVVAGTVVTASPSNGSAPYGSTVALAILRGPSPRTVPSLAGSTYTAAESSLANLKLVPSESTAYSSTVPSGLVIATDPAGGTTGVAVGTTVNVQVSKGPQPVAVPTVAGDSIATAIEALKAAGLNVTEQIGPPFATVASTTSPAPGTEVPPGTNVTLYVS